MKDFDYRDIQTIGLDADDTLWTNEIFFREAESKFAKLFSHLETENKLLQEIYKAEISNLDIYGYGIKGFILSMIECANLISNNNITPKQVNSILEIGKDMLNKPVELLPGVEDTLLALNSKYRLLLITKGDLLDQENKLEKSGLSKYFHHVEVVSNKKKKNYQELLGHLQIPVKEFLMIGNSLKSDVLPLIDIGAKAIHVPFHTTWEHEKVDCLKGYKYQTVSNLKDILDFI